MHLSVTNLQKSYGDFTLSIGALDVAPGTAFGLVGNNGAGKTTLLRLVLDLIAPDGGTVALDGTPVTDATDWKSHVGAYLGESFLLDFLTPDEYWRFVGQTHDVAPDVVETRLEPFQDFYTDEPIGATTKYIRDLSQGNRNKAGLIGALLPEPDLVVLDEPFASLDPRSQLRLRDILQDRRGSATLLLSSHDLGHITDVCERIVLLDDGAIVRDDTTTDTTLDDLRAHFAGNAPSATAA